MLAQRKIPGIIGISTYVDYIYNSEMQLTAIASAGTKGPINQLRTVTVTLDFKLLVENLQAGRQNDAEEQVAVASHALEAAGSDFIVVTSGTTSTLTGRARQRVSIPFLDLADACWRQASPIGPVGLLCTRYAAAGGIFQASAKNYGTTIVLSPPDTAERIDQVIFGELICGEISDVGIRILRDAIDELTALGAGSVILGNTDLALIAEQLQASSKVSLVDAARAHARDAAHTALSNF
jgi:aspartate racemase